MSPMEQDDLSKADIGIVCALPMEVTEFLSRCQRVRTYHGEDFVFRGGMYDGIRIVVVEAGTGRSRAIRATRALCEAHHPGWVLSCGYAGALAPQVHKGDIVVPDRFLAQDAEEIRIDLSMASDPARRLHVGPLLTVDAIVRKAEDKLALGQQTTAIAVDMETHAVARQCKLTHHRFLAVRVITDDTRSDLPEEVLSLMGATGATRFGAVVGALWKRPSSAQDMLKLREDADRASKNLADFLDGVIHQLHRADKSAAEQSPRTPAR